MHVQTIYSNKHGRLTLTFNNWYKHDYIIQLVDYFFYRHHICPVWWTSASTDDRCDIPMGTHCAPLLADVVLHAYNAFVIQWFPKNKNWKLTQTFNSSFLYIWDGLELNNSRIDDYMHLINLSEFNSLFLTFTFTWQKESTTNVTTSLAKYSTTNSSFSISQKHQRMEFVSQMSYVNKGCVPSTVILQKENSCGAKTSQPTLCCY